MNHPLFLHLSLFVGVGPLQHDISRKHTGRTAQKPKKYSVKCMDSLTTVWYAKRTLGKWMSKSCWFACTTFANIASSVQLNLSTCPLPCGWYAVVWVHVIPNNEQRCWTTALVKLAPTLWILCGTPYRHTISSTSTMARVVAFVECSGKVSTQLAMRSVTTKIYLRLLDDPAVGP